MQEKIIQKNNYNLWCNISKLSLEYHAYFSKFKDQKCKENIKLLMNPEIRITECTKYNMYIRSIPKPQSEKETYVQNPYEIMITF